MDLKGPSRTFEDSWVPIISRGSPIGSDIPCALGLVYEDLVKKAPCINAEFAHFTMSCFSFLFFSSYLVLVSCGRVRLGMRMIGGNPDQEMQASILLMKSQISVTVTGSTTDCPSQFLIQLYI